MKKFKANLKALWSDDSGQSTVEYILILAVVVMVATKFRTTFNSRLGTIIEKVGVQIDSATADSP